MYKTLDDAIDLFFFILYIIIKISSKLIYLLIKGFSTDTIHGEKKISKQIFYFLN